MLTAMMSSAVIPFGEKLVFGDISVSLAPVDANIGILYIFGVVSLGVYGVMIGGWASNNKFSLLGAIRAASQNISYELAMGLSIIAILMISGSLNLGDIVTQQRGFLNWNIFAQPVGFIIFCTCAFAECNRTPFDLPECESELVGGYHTEYSSMKLGLYLFSEYVNMFVAGMVMSTLYFGGYDYPFYDLVVANLGQNIATLIGFGAIVGKGIAFIFFFMWIRWTLPRFRYDQLMNLGWTRLIPIAIVNIMVTGAVIMLKDFFIK
jgi:NADH-quinone oxidoreductase subunit H